MKGYDETKQKMDALEKYPCAYITISDMFYLMNVREELNNDVLGTKDWGLTVSNVDGILQRVRDRSISRILGGV